MKPSDSQNKARHRARARCCQREVLEREVVVRGALRDLADSVLELVVAQEEGRVLGHGADDRRGDALQKQNVMSDATCTR